MYNARSMGASCEAVLNWWVQVPPRQRPESLVADSGARPKSLVLSGVTGQVWYGTLPYGTLSATVRAATLSESCGVVRLQSRKAREPSRPIVGEGRAQGRDNNAGTALGRSGVGGAARADSSTRNRRDPPEWPLSGQAAPISLEKSGEGERSSEGVRGGRSTRDREESITSRREGPLLEPTLHEVSVRVWPQGPSPRSERNVPIRRRIENARELCADVTSGCQARKRARPVREALGKPCAGKPQARFDWEDLKTGCRLAFSEADA